MDGHSREYTRGGPLDAAPPYDERFYRYSVRCDRAFSKLIEKAAAAAGVSVNEFVQAHFDRILDKPAGELGFDPKTFDAARFATKNQLTLTQAKVWGALARKADDKHEVRIACADLGRPLNLDRERCRKIVSDLVAAGFLTRLHSHAGPQGSLYRVEIDAAFGGPSKPERTTS